MSPISVSPSGSGQTSSLARMRVITSVMVAQPTFRQAAMLRLGR
ncbi:hypothetical protein PZA22_17475 [Pectobacterium polaris]|nr:MULTISPECIES: hypothetical protein [Pectobacterium]MDE8756280.1 hypothetical protein [Pectobacterium polaris]